MKLKLFKKKKKKREEFNASCDRQSQTSAHGDPFTTALIFSLIGLYFTGVVDIGLYFM